MNYAWIKLDDIVSQDSSDYYKIKKSLIPDIDFNRLKYYYWLRFF